MNKKEKLIMYLIFIILLVFLLKKVLNVSSFNYKIKKDNKTFYIKERYNKNMYNLEIILKDKIFPINIYDNLNKKNKIVNNIYYYEDENYECMLPIFNNKVLTDVMCYNDGIIYNYNQIIGRSSKLDQYISKIKEYNVKDYENKDTYSTKDTIKFFDNDISNIISITSYKGLYINKMPMNLFQKDVYKNKISIYVDNYYLIADYNDSYEFSQLYLVDLLDRTAEKIKLKDPISFDSFIQGVVNNKVYIYDYDNENQYEVDVYNKKISIVSSKEYIKYYTNTKWEKLSKSKVKRSTYFDYSTLDKNFTDYDIVKEASDYYYLLNKNNDNYKIYRVNKNNINIITYIGEVPTLELKFNNDYFYYMYDNKLYFYSDKTGFKIILEDSEIEFNDTIKYYIY